ncbi:MAG: hypothetical protein MJ198_00785 [Bacteroidales bacterium]|nr:hypothetical protein [Bacteroidales bacterium]
MNKLLSLIFFCFFTTTVFSQNTTFLHKGTSYPAITFTFTTYVTYDNDPRLLPDKDVNVTIAKKGSAGYIELSLIIKSDKELCDYFHKCGIFGDISLDMANGKKITCKDLGISDFIEGKATAVYQLTAQDMLLLQQSNIEIINFSMQTFSEKASYQAANFHHFYSETPDEFTKKKERVETTKVPELMKLLK